jgi:hypothetical protein
VQSIYDRSCPVFVQRPFLTVDPILATALSPEARGPSGFPPTLCKLEFSGAVFVCFHPLPSCVFSSPFGGHPFSVVRKGLPSFDNTHSGNSPSHFLDQALRTFKCTLTSSHVLLSQIPLSFIQPPASLNLPPRPLPPNRQTHRMPPPPIRPRILQSCNIPQHLSLQFIFNLQRI